MNVVISFIRGVLFVMAVSVGVYIGAESFFDGAGSLVSIGAAILSGALVLVLSWVYNPAKTNSTKGY